MKNLKINYSNLIVNVLFFFSVFMLGRLTFNILDVYRVGDIAKVLREIPTFILAFWVVVLASAMFYRLSYSILPTGYLIGIFFTILVSRIGIWNTIFGDYWDWIYFHRLDSIVVSLIMFVSLVVFAYWIKRRNKKKEQT